MRDGIWKTFEREFDSLTWAADALGKNEDARAAEVVAFAYFSKGGSRACA
jgi:hypothetical protein